MTNILFINGNLNVGGVEMALVNLLNCLDNSKYSIDLLLLQDGYVYENNLSKYVNCIKVKIDEGQGPICNAICKCIKDKNWTSLSYRLINIFASRISPKFFKFIYLGRKLKPKYDYVISFRPGICADLALYKFNSEYKICWWHHGDICGSLMELYNQLSGFKRIIAVSNGVKELLNNKFPKLESKIEVLPNCIDINKINTKAFEYYPYPRLNNGEVFLRIVSVSRLSAEKNVSMAIEVAKCLKFRNINFEWHIIGGGDCMQSIKDGIKKAGLEACLHLEGNQKNPYPWIVGADMMVHLSTVESFGLVILEAMCLGVPCIAIESIGAKELINNVNGICIPSNSELIAEEIVKLSKDKERYNMIIRNARATVDEYSQKKVFNQFEKRVLG